MDALYAHMHASKGSNAAPSHRCSSLYNNSPLLFVSTMPCESCFLDSAHVAISVALLRHADQCQLTRLFSQFFLSHAPVYARTCTRFSVYAVVCTLLRVRHQVGLTRLLASCIC
jgi:hypothetical protein